MNCPSDDQGSGPNRPTPDFPVVGIGASAGGLEALKQFFTAMPPDTGLAFVLVQHLDPDHESLMADLLAKYTAMPVNQAVDGLAVEPDHVYVIPPKHYLSISGGVLHLSPPTERRGMRMPIDHFLRSLAEDCAEKAICVILSGTGSDGSLGLREIKGHGGMTIVQEPSTAQYDGMPHSALATGLADCRLAVEAMPEAMMRYVHHSYARGEIPAGAMEDDPSDELGAIIAVVRARTGHDFRHYKKGTLSRRIARRMSLATIENLQEYLELLRSTEDEVHKLVRDLLISVTSFFREPQAFETLVSVVVPTLVERADPDNPIRIWIPGCASGEEAYSLAMVMLDGIRRSGKQVGLQIFATDIDVEALDIARVGVYPVSAIAELPAEYQRQFFSREGDNVTVNKSVRETVVIAAQNLISDPPFSRLDFISCRNLLIYLDIAVQTRIIRLFHFALRDGGYLFLGNSETIGQRTDMFRTVSKKWRIYRRLAVPSDMRGADYYPVPGSTRAPTTPGTLERSRPSAGRRMSERVDGKLLQEYAPAAVLVDRAGEALYFRGDTDLYLEMPTGVATHDIVALARDGIRTALRSALQSARADKAPAEARRVLLRHPNGSRKVRIKVWRMDELDGTCLVCFAQEQEPVQPSKVRPGDEALVSQLEYELKATREDLQTTIEEVETANEELKAANEEVMSMNEELQSTNEELETSKEELQSLNEELSTVNNQLLDKLHELEAANNDLANLLTSTDIATIFLDAKLQIRRYTPSATRMFALIDADIGRPIADVAQRFSNGVLTDECRQVLKDLKPFQEEVRGSDGHWFQLRVLPYRTIDNHIDGVVITFTDISAIKQAYSEAQVRERQLRIIADSLPVLIAHIDVEHRFRFVNGAYERWFGIKADQVIGRPLCELFGVQAYETLCPQLQASAAGRPVDAPARLQHRSLGEREVNLTWVPERGSDGSVVGFYSLIHDVTDQKRDERRLMAADVVFRSTTEAAAILDDRGGIIAVNPAFIDVSGYDGKACVGKNWAFILAEPKSDQSSLIWNAANEGGGWRGEAWLRRAGGEVFAAWLTIDSIHPQGGEKEVRGFVIVFADISTVKEAERRLEFLAHHDPLTGLSNRVMFNERLAHVLTRSMRQKKVVALLYLDLDGFKHVNDSFGHEVGDRVLVVVGERLKSWLRAEDTLARLGGDEFGVLLEEVTDPWAAAQAAEKIIEGMRAPVKVDGRDLVIGVSIGISLFPNDGDNVTLLIRNADTAMYQAKGRGGNCAHFYTPALTEAVQQRVSVESALREAMEEGALELYFQPIVSLAVPRVIGVEALVRWRAEGRGVLLPESFLPIAELSGLINQLGAQVIELAFRQLATWRAAGLVVPPLSINISARQCMEEGFVGTLREALTRHNIRAAEIDLEITESSFLDKNAALRVLPGLKNLGVSLTIDDFGTGYATLASLRHAPISAIKIDRAFVDDISGPKGNDTIARAVIALGKAQRLRVIAEGVETRAQFDLLAAMGCDACQGFMIAPPMPAETFAAWIAERADQVEAP